MHFSVINRRKMYSYVWCPNFILFSKLLNHFFTRTLKAGLGLTVHKKGLIRNAFKGLKKQEKIIHIYPHLSTLPILKHTTI